jgi:starch phosphorylase
MLRDNLYYSDPFLCLADFESYSECQKKVDIAFREKSRWAKMAILNTARVGKFSSDRAIREYARDIWKVESVSV